MKLAAVGDNCIDYYVDKNEGFPGGNPVNVSVYFRRFNESSSYTGVVGDDSFGQLMIDSLKTKGVDTSHIRVETGKTAITEVHMNGKDRVLGDYDEGVLKNFKLSDEDIRFLATHDIVVSGCWGMIEKDLGKIKNHGVKIAFDFATKLEGDIIEDAIPYVDLAFFSDDDQDGEILKEFMIKIHLRGPKVVIVTRGEHGSLAYDGSNFYQFGIVPTCLVDTMGAGDSYIAGFIYGYLKGLSIIECMRLGAENSATTLTYYGAW